MAVKCEIFNADARRNPLPDGFVHFAITSPPYYSQRDYGNDGADWPEVAYAPMAGLPPVVVPTMKSPLGNEPTIDSYVGHLLLIFREVRRVLRDDGTLVLNLGDSYASKPNGPSLGASTLEGGIAPHAQFRLAHAKRARGLTNGLKHKDLCMVPSRVAMALQADGWYLRSVAPWLKPNVMPESVTDRPASATESFFLLSKGSCYFYDADAVRKPHLDDSLKRWAAGGEDTDNTKYDKKARQTGVGNLRNGSNPIHCSGRSRRTSDWWRESLKLWAENGGYVTDEAGLPLGVEITTSGFGGAHFACWPPRLLIPWIKACTSEKGCCPSCGAPYRRRVERERFPTRPGFDSKVNRASEFEESPYNEHGGMVVGNRDPLRHVTATRTVGWEPGCACGAGEPVACRVLDPFSGAASTAIACLDLGRDYYGTEVNPEYVAMSSERIEAHRRYMVTGEKPRRPAKPQPGEMLLPFAG